MNNVPEPLSPNAVDALLSAELDGELEAASAELGLGPAEALARLEATPGVAARRVAFTRARDLIAAPPALDPTVEALLVSKALAGNVADIAKRRDRRARRWQVLVATGSVAAAIALVVGISSTRGDQSAKRSSVAAGAARAPTSPTTHAGVLVPSTKSPNFGDISRQSALRERALPLVVDNPLLDNGAQHQEVQTSAGNPESTPKAASLDAPDAGKSSAFNAALPADCLLVLKVRYGVTTSPVLEGTGTVSGRPVRVLVFEGPGGPVAYVVSAGDCSLVRKQPL